MGTLGYMAPEQIRGDLKAIGPACDIYALGVILYELLTGRLPFSGSGLAVAGQILTQTPCPLRRFGPTSTPRLEAICLKAMAKQVGDRYASMGELAAALTGFPSFPGRDFATRTGLASTTTILTRHRRQPARSRHRVASLGGRRLDRAAVPARPRHRLRDHRQGRIKIVVDDPKAVVKVDARRSASRAGRADQPPCRRARAAGHVGRRPVQDLAHLSSTRGQKRPCESNTSRPARAASQQAG